jgi:glutamate dehydrogenase (NADP+)
VRDANEIGGAEAAALVAGGCAAVVEGANMRPLRRRYASWTFAQPEQWLRETMRDIQAATVDRPVSTG